MRRRCAINDLVKRNDVRFFDRQLLKTVEKTPHYFALPRSGPAVSHSAVVDWHPQRYCHGGFPERVGVVADPSVAIRERKMDIVAPDPAAEGALGLCSRPDSRTYGPMVKGIWVETQSAGILPPGKLLAAVDCCKGPKLNVDRTSPSCVAGGGTGERSSGPALAGSH